MTYFYTEYKILKKKEMSISVQGKEILIEVSFIINEKDSIINC